MSATENSNSSPNSLRRNLLKVSTLLPLSGALAAFNATLLQAAAKEIAGYEPALQPHKATLQKWLKQLHDFGPIRATGTKECRAFEEWLAAQFTQLGFSLERDQFKL